MFIIVILGAIAYLTREIVNPLVYIIVGFAFFLVDTWLFTKGYDTSFWKHLTPNELEAQRKKLGIHNDS